MDNLQALHAGAVQPPEGKSAAPEDPDGEVRGRTSSLIRMCDMNPLKGYYTKLRATHHRMLLRILGAWCKSPNKRILSCKDALQQIECEGMETTVRTGRLLWSRALLRMGAHRLPKRVMSGELENARNRGPGRKEKEWTDYVAENPWLFCITRDCASPYLTQGFGTAQYVK